MVKFNRSVLAKAIFSVSVVAITATAGAMGFAQAAHNTSRGAVLAASDGYGGTGAAVQAAVEEFQRALGAASEKFQTDVAKCVADRTGNSADLTNNFRSSSTEAVSDFSASTASPTAFGTVNKFDSQVTKANASLETQLNTDTNRLLSAFDSRQASLDHRSDFRKCMNTARKDFRESLSDARRDFRTALRGIFS
jgi:hypothetical protein